MAPSHHRQGLLAFGTPPGSKFTDARKPGAPPFVWVMQRLAMLCVFALSALLVYSQVQLFKTASSAARAAAAAAALPESAAADAAAAAASAAGDASFPVPQLRHLVLIACHAVYTGLDFATFAAKETSWFLEPYQQVPGEAASFLAHIRLGIEAAAADPDALLLFSGGQTRQAAGPRSEGSGYWLVAEAADWYGHQAVRSRAFTEEHARDSFENLLFSLCRFYELTGHYPQRITVVSYSLKQARFEQLHRAAVRFPAAAFSFVGTPVPPEATGAEAGEAATVAAFRSDPYGCSGALLAKRARRDPFAVGAPHASRCPGMAGLLRHCGPRPFAGRLPWQEPGAGGSGAGDGLPAGRRSSRSGLYT